MNDTALTDKKVMNIPGVLRQLAASADALQTLIKYSEGMTSIENATAEAHIKLSQLREQIGQERALSDAQIANAHKKSKEIIDNANDETVKMLSETRLEIEALKCAAQAELLAEKAENDAKILHEKDSVSIACDEANKRLNDINNEILSQSEILKEKEDRIKALNETLKKISA